MKLFNLRKWQLKTIRHWATLESFNLHADRSNKRLRNIRYKQMCNAERQLIRQGYGKEKAENIVLSTHNLLFKHLIIDSAYLM